MYISNIEIKNYLIHKDTGIEMLPLTVFVGPNGGGKSAFFDALLNFSMLARGSLRQAFGPYPFSYRATVHRGASGVARIGYRVTMKRQKDDQQALRYEIDYNQSGAAEDSVHFTIFNERLVRLPGNEVLFDRSEPDVHKLGRSLSLDAERSVFACLRQAKPADVEVHEDVTYFTQQIGRFNKFRLDPFVLSQPSRTPDLGSNDSPINHAPRLGYHGEDLASTLYYLSETNNPAINEIRDRLKAFDASIVDFEFNMIGADRVGFSVAYNDSRKTVTAVRLSSGMLIFIGLMTLVFSPNRPSVLMIEEPENGLTPQAVKLFYKSVRTLAFNDKPDNRSQVLISSHSPFVICEAWNGEDRDFIYQAKVEEGKGIMRKFSDVVKTHGIQLKKVDGERKHLGLSTAEEVMSGYLS